MKLFGTPRSPFARRVRFALLKAGIPFEWVELSLSEIFPPSDRLLKMNPLGLIPVLELDDGVCLVDSTEILTYIDSNLFPLWPSEMPHKTQARQVSMLANGIMTYAVREFQGLRVESPLDGSLESNIDLISRVLDRLEFVIAVMPEVQRNTYPESNNLKQSVWDVAMALEYLDFRLSDKLDWRSNRPHLSNWFDAARGDRDFAATAPG
ncbi:MAG: glutathione S-transferase family protein [Silvanigrellaceae bacterium]